MTSYLVRGFVSTDTYAMSFPLCDIKINELYRTDNIPKLVAGGAPMYETRSFDFVSFTRLITFHKSGTNRIICIRTIILLKMYRKRKDHFEFELPETKPFMALSLQLTFYNLLFRLYELVVTTPLEAILYFKFFFSQTIEFL